MKAQNPKPYWDKNWLIQEYVIFERSADDIAGQCGVTRSPVENYLRKHNIPVRTQLNYWPPSERFKKLLDLQIVEEDIRHTSEWEPLTRKELLTSINWKELRKRILIKDNYICQRCGAKNTKFIIHHILPFHWHIEVLNPKYLILLCSGCHVWVHSRENVKLEYLASPLGRRVYFDPRVYQNFA